MGDTWMFSERPPVLTKADFARRYAIGEFGNASPTWTNVQDFIDWGCKEFGNGPNARPSEGLFHLRNGVVAGGITYYKLHWSEATAKWLDQPDKSNWFVSMQIPPEVEASLLLQGEVYQYEPAKNGLHLYYTTVPKPMRNALKEWSHQTSGLHAVSLLRQALCPNSYEWLMELLDLYPYHVVEFSAYGKKWGTLYPNFNCVYWEVRRY
jgi:hypothetical protein